MYILIYNFIVNMYIKIYINKITPINNYKSTKYTYRILKRQKIIKNVF